MRHDQTKANHKYRLTNLAVALKRIGLAFGAMLVLTSTSGVAQDKKRQPQAKPSPVYSQLAAPVRERYANLFKPDFAKLNLVGSFAGDGANHVTKVEQFDSGSKVSFQLVINNASEAMVVIHSPVDSHVLNRPQLYKDGNLVSYRENVTESLQGKDKRFFDGRSNVLKLEPKTSITETINLDDWYDALRPGHYKLSVWRRFIWGGEWLESPTITFEIVKTRSNRLD